MAYLSVQFPGGEVQRIKLEKSVSLGRALENEVALEDPSVSRHHCRVEPSGEGWEIVDLGSRNGTRVNGVRVERQGLSEGDVIMIGQTRIGYHSAKLTGPRPADPIESAMSETMPLIPPRRGGSEKPLPTPGVTSADGQSGEESEMKPLPFTRPPARPMVKEEGSTE